MAVNKEGNWISNVNTTDVNAVTWGVFPAKEITQPTVVDAASFTIWKDEAFEIWSRGWGNLYPETDPSRKLLEQVSIYQSLYHLYELLHHVISPKCMNENLADQNRVELDHENNNCLTILCVCS